MDRVVSYEQVQGFVGDIRNLRQGFVTNFFWDERKHPYWVEAQSLFFGKTDHCYLLLHQNGEFSNLFYIATDMGAVAEAIGQTALETDSVIDIVSKKDGQEETEILKGVGFEPYRQLFRMSHIGQLADNSWEEPEGVTMGEDADAEQVYDALQQGFDPLCEQLPSMQEVRDYIQRRQLLVVREGRTLCGFLIYELSGQTSWYLRYWYTVPEYRNRKVGSRLLKAALLKGRDTRRQQLWVVSDNENAIRRYEHYGFKRETVTDHVMIKYRQNERKDC